MRDSACSGSATRGRSADRPVVAAGLANVLARDEPAIGVGRLRLLSAVHPAPHRSSEPLPEVAAVRRHGAQEHHGAHVLRMRDRVRRGEKRPI